MTLNRGRATRAPSIDCHHREKRMPQYIIRAARDGKLVREDIFESPGMEAALERAKQEWPDVGRVGWLALRGEDYPRMAARLTARKR